MTDEAGAGRGRVLFLRFVKVVLAVGAAAGIAYALRDYRHSLAGRLEQIRMGWLLAGAAICAVYRIVNAFGWVLVLRALGQPIPPARGVRLWLVSETLRWLPGSVWSFFSRVGQAKASGIPPAVASLSLPLELLLTIAAWVATALAGVGFSGVAREWLTRLPGTWVVATMLGLLSCVALLPAIARWGPATRLSARVQGLKTALAQIRRARPSIPSLLGIGLLYLVLCFVNGAAFHATLSAAGGRPPSLLAAVGINAVGWLLGFFAFFAPAGLGVREGGMAAMLAPSMPLDAAIVGVLLWRLIQIAVELLCLLPCLLPNVISAVLNQRLRRTAGDPGASR